MEDNSPECIAKNVKKALNHPDLDKIVKNARELVEKEYTYEAAVKRYRKILENLGVKNHE
jgi:glycosyltransferase involved in cell wall biosynthesis